MLDTQEAVGSIPTVSTLCYTNAMCEKREKLIQEIEDAIYQNRRSMKEAAEAALHVIERKADTHDERILPCTCDHNGYGEHRGGCALAD